MTTPTQLRRKPSRVDLRWVVLDRVMFIRRFYRVIRNHIMMCSKGKKDRIGYNKLSHCSSSSTAATATPSRSEGVAGLAVAPNGYETDSDLVALKITVLGDSQIGKTSFVVKYIGDDRQGKRNPEMNGLNLVDKMFSVRGARIAYSIWDVGGDHRSDDHLPLACKDSSAILIMFDLTSRRTLNSVLGWYKKARTYNQTAIPILIGTKFDEFVHLPLAVQWTIVCQARSYARAMKATLFFSSATHNINVNKIFKFITAQLFNLPWTVERNLTLGEPIIDY